MKTVEYIEKPKNRIWKLCSSLFVLWSALCLFLHMSGVENDVIHEVGPSVMVWAIIGLPVFVIGWAFKS